MTKNDNSGTHYARNCHGQPNENAASADRRQDWTGSNNACSVDTKTIPKGSATSSYIHDTIKIPLLNGKSKKITLIDKPWTFTGHDFGLNIPTCAYIKSITFTARMKVDGTITVKAPYARFNLYHGSNSVPTNIKDHTGWDNGIYYHNPNKKLSSSWSNITYKMSGEEFHKKGYSVSELNEQRMGIDLRFFDATTQKSTVHKISIQYISCYVEYEMPDQSVVFDDVTGENSPLIKKSGEEFGVVVKYRNNSNAGCCGDTSKKIKIDLPPNATARALNGNYNPTTSEWTVNCTPNAFQFLALGVTDYGIGEKSITVSNADVNTKLWYYTEPNPLDVGHVTPYPDTYMQRGIKSCVKFISKVNATDGEVTFNINLDTVHNSAQNVEWNLVSKESSPGVEITNYDDNTVTCTVPRGEPVDIVWTGCFVPSFEGRSTVEVYLGSQGDYAEYVSLPAPTYIVRNTPQTKSDDRTVSEITFTPSIINFATHRVASSTEIGAYVIDCAVAEFDSQMVENDCTFTAGIWQKHNYIGMVELPFTHYDPKSTFENKEIYKNYKNKTYAGKEGSVDEDITLNFKVRPKDTITLQGLVELDKPTPINANWRCFEGDPLNHRGWAVFSKLQVERTNPLWYKCEGTVKYITHDINTKFQIFEESKANTEDMPTILADTFTIGDNLSDSLDIFDIDTDGGFIYDDEGEDGAKNIFSLDDEQYLSIKSRNPLAAVSQLRFDWYSNRINETRENNLERIFRIRDKDGNSVFEYEYTDFVFEEDYVYCTGIMRVKDPVEGWQTHIFPNVDMRTEIEADPITIETNTASYDDSADEDEAFVINLDEIITDPNNPDYDEDIPVATYEDNLIRRITIKIKDTETYVFNQSFNESEHIEVQLDDLDLSNVSNNSVLDFMVFDSSGEELTEYTYDYLTEVGSGYIHLFELDDENGEAYEEGYIAPSFNPEEYDITQIYGSSIELIINKNKLKFYDAGYNGREVVKEDIELINSDYYFETEWINHNQDGTTENIISYIDIGLSETILSATYAEQYGNLKVSPFPIPKKEVVFTRESEEGTIYYLTGVDPFKYRLEPFYQYLCGTDLVTREGASIFNLNNSHTYFYIENGLVRLGFNKYSGSLYLAKWDIISKDWITTHYLHMDEDTKFSLEQYSDDKIIIKAGNDTYFSIWRGHPYIMIQNPNTDISIDSKFTYCLADKVDGTKYPYPVIASFMNEDNLLPSCVGGQTLDYDCISIDDDVISGGTEHTLTVGVTGTPISGESATITTALSPTTTDGEIHILLDDEDIGTVSPGSSLAHLFPLTTNDTSHTLQAVYTGDTDDKIAISPKIPITVKAPDARPGTPADIEHQDVPGKYALKMVSAPSKFTYKDNKYIELQLTKGGKGVRMPIEVQRPSGRTSTEYTNSDGRLKVYNKNYDVGEYQWGARFYDNIDADHDGKLMLSALKDIPIKKATPTFTHNANKGRVSKGKKLGIKLNSVESIADPNKAGIGKVNVTYSLNGGAKKTKKTDSKGWIQIPFNTKKTYKVKVMFAGNKNYKSIPKTFTIKVV